jgi:hypothetical protein
MNNKCKWEDSVKWILVKQTIKRRIPLNCYSFTCKAFVMVIIRIAQTVVPDVSRKHVIPSVRSVQEDISTLESETTRLHVLNFSWRQNSIKFSRVFSARGFIQTTRLSRNVGPSDLALHPRRTKASSSPLRKPKNLFHTC